jgi:BolA family transcriptional regulator, general stress-responsive regulator
MGSTMSLEAKMRHKLTIGLEPVRLDIINESEKHAGHRSSPGTGESHFRVLIVSEKFAGQSRLARHRMVNQLVADELAAGVHAFALSTYAPGEKD